MTKIIAVSNQKGGVAKTTSCFSLGACLAERGFRTLVVDLDPQAHLTIAAGLNPDDLLATIVDLLEPNRETSGQQVPVQKTGLENFEILPGDLRLANLEHSLAGQDGYEYLLKEMLSQLNSAAWQIKQARYDFILLDCPPSLGTLTVIALTAADLALIPVQCEYFASRGLLRLIDVLEAIKAHTNPGIEYFVFASLFDGRNLISRQVMQELQQHFKKRMLNAVIRQDTRLRECPMAGEPVIVYAPRTRASAEYRELAGELVRRLKIKEPAG